MIETVLESKKTVPKSFLRADNSEYKDNLETVSFQVGNRLISGDETILFAGPCAVHNRDQIMQQAEELSNLGVTGFRAGAYKPRTNPRSFQGLKEKGLEMLQEVKEQFGLPIVTEVVDPRDAGLVAQYADVLQIGARNMCNYALLSEVGKQATTFDRAVLLKTLHGIPTSKEVLGAVEYLTYEGANKVIVCERGSPTTKEYRDYLSKQMPGSSVSKMRNIPNYDLVSELRETIIFPVIGDPSHTAGDRDIVLGVAKDYLMSGANGLIIETIRDNEQPIIDGVLVCDYEQGLHLKDFKRFVGGLDYNCN